MKKGGKSKVEMIFSPKELLILLAVAVLIGGATTVVTIATLFIH